MPEKIHLRGETNEIKVPIHGNVVIQKGEDIFIAQDANCIVGASTDRYGYPASYLAAVTDTYHAQNYAGISMNASKSGVTEDILVAQTGIFRAQIRTSASSQTCKIGQTVAGASVGASGVSVSGTTVTVGTGGDHNKARIGRVVKYEHAAHEVDFMLMTRMSGASIV